MKLHEMYFDTYEECERNRDEYNRKNIWFCPLIKNNCRHDCVCYNPGSIYHNRYTMDENRNKFNTYPGYCCYKPFIEE